MNRFTRSAFTLIELLVVITIIGILLALLMPVANDAKERARSARCVANLKQLHTAVLSMCMGGSDMAGIPAARSTETRKFRSDPNGNRTPDGWRQSGKGWVDWHSYDAAEADSDLGDTDEHGDCHTYWYGDAGRVCNTNGALYAYARDDAIYVCPSFQKKYTGPAKEKAVRSYVMNKYKGGNIQVSDAARKILFADGAYSKMYDGAQVCQYGLEEGARVQKEGGDSGRGWYTAMDGMLDSDAWQSGPLKERIGSDHHGRGNVVFLDGHVEVVTYAETKQVCTGDWGEY